MTALRARNHLGVLLNELVDEVGSDESHPLALLMEVIGLLIEKYENEHVPELDREFSVREDPPETGKAP